MIASPAFAGETLIDHWTTAFLAESPSDWRTIHDWLWTAAAERVYGPDVSHHQDAATAALAALTAQEAT